MLADAVARISTTALQNNLEIARRSAPGCPVMAVIKADAYGHDLTLAAHALNTADAFGVARFPAAVRLREAGVEQSIVVLSGSLDEDSAALARELQLQVAVYDLAQISVLEQLADGPSIRVWLKVDTGMGRLGILPQDFAIALSRLRECPAVADDICLMTHLSCADDTASGRTREQLDLFGATIGNWSGDVSIANSAGILGCSEAVQSSSSLQYAGRNWIRPGLMLYGVSPLLGRSGAELGLEPAMTLEGRLLTIRSLPAGSPVGYGADWQADRDSRIGVVNIGYADGYPWRLSNQAAVEIRGRKVPVVGRVSMDMISIDLTDCPQVSTGDRVTLWGQSPTVESLAEQLGTSPYELLTGVGPRVVRQSA